jgi:predicted GTPase
MITGIGEENTRIIVQIIKILIIRGIKIMRERRTKVIILGAAGRDFHNFNVYFRENPKYEVVCFTAAQIPNIAGRIYPKKLAGKLYPKGIPIYEEERLEELISKYDVDKVILAYSDLSHEEVMHKASIAVSKGADYLLMGPKSTMLKSRKKVISICATRTGCGKSQTTRYIANLLRKNKIKYVIVRHPMPYGDLEKMEVQRFEKYEDLEKNKCTIEEREEYEGHIREGSVVYAGVDYEKILRKAEKEADVILWDGGNNDFPFFKPDLHIVVTDPFRAGHELRYWPGEANVRMADVVLINKINTARKEDILSLETNIKVLNKKAEVIKASSEIILDKKIDLRGKKVLVIEDGPTLTHGGMKFGAGFLIAKKMKAEILNPLKFGKGILKEYLKKYDLEYVIPAMGYSEEEIKALEKTINSSKCEYVINASPVNLKNILKVRASILNVTYYLKVVEGNLDKIVIDALK